MRLEEIYEETLRVGSDRQEMLDHIRQVRNNFTALTGRLEYLLLSQGLRSEPGLQRQLQELSEGVEALAQQFDQYTEFSHISGNPDTSRDRVRQSIN